MTISIHHQEELKNIRQRLGEILVQSESATRSEEERAIERAFSWLSQFTDSPLTEEERELCQQSFLSSAEAEVDDPDLGCMVDSYWGTSTLEDQRNEAEQWREDLSEEE